MAGAGLQVREIAYPAGLHQPRHAHDSASVTLVLSGSLEERSGRRCERGLALSVVVKPAGVEHDDRFGTAGAATLQIAVGGAAAAALERRGALLEQWRWIPAAAAVGPFARLLEAMRADAPPPAVQDRAWDVLGTVADEVAGRTGVSGAPPAWLARLREWVDDDPAAPHRVHQLAASAGVHPVHLSRAFRRHYGITLSEHIRRRRLQHAAALVARGDASLAAAAARAGFADQSHFGRHLRARTGITPSRLRAISQAPRLQTF